MSEPQTITLTRDNKEYTLRVPDTHGAFDQLCRWPGYEHIWYYRNVEMTMVLMGDSRISGYREQCCAEAFTYWAIKAIKRKASDEFKVPNKPHLIGLDEYQWAMEWICWGDLI